MRVALTVPGRAVPAQRMTQKSKWSARARRSLDYQERVAWETRAARIRDLQGSLAVTVMFYFHDRRHGDLDNHIKAIFDGLQYGGAFANDRQVRRLVTEIRYDTEERVEIEIEEMS